MAATANTGQKIAQLVGNTWKLRGFFLLRLPSLWWWGVRIKSFSADGCQTTIPYGWRTQNPFQSVYFAAQAGAAEFSTGLLALDAISRHGAVSMLITNMEARFVKKATTAITFTCAEGQAIAEAVAQAKTTGIPQTITVSSTGVQASGEVVSHFSFTWSFKAKS
jgi:hypothetical protein